jgi:hypothetical protein
LKVLLDTIELNVSKTLFGNVIVEYNGQTISINGDLFLVMEVIKRNYEKIKDHYISNIFKSKAELDVHDLNKICVEILIHYLDQNNRWKNQYAKSNYDSNFSEKDFEHPETNDIVIRYLKNKYHDSWKSRSLKYLDMTSDKFEFYYANRNAYFNK